MLTGLVLGALLNSLAGQVALSDPSEPNAAEAQSISTPTRENLRSDVLILNSRSGLQTR